MIQIIGGLEPNDDSQNLPDNLMSPELRGGELLSDDQVLLTSKIHHDSEPPKLASILKSYGFALVLGTALQCLYCNHLFLSDEAPSHWKNQHASDSLLRQTRQTLPQLVAELTNELSLYTGFLTSREEFVALHASNPLPFMKLPITKGYQCSKADCEQVFLELSTFRKHAQNKHKDEEVTIISVQCQQVWMTNISNTSRCLLVVPKVHNIDGTIGDDEIRQLLQSTPFFSGYQPSQDSQNLQQRDIAAFLKGLGYVDRTSGIPSHTVLDSLNVTGRESFDVLKTLTLVYLKVTQAQIQHATRDAPMVLALLEKDDRNR